MDDGCPTAEALQELLDDVTDPDGAMETHVQACARCQQRLDVLTDYPRLAAVGTRDAAWTESYSGAVMEHVATALVQDSKHGSLFATVFHKANEDDGRFPEIPGYEILSRIGVGGSADVYRAFHRQLRRVVALKIIRDRARPEQRDRFRREAESLAKLSHPGIIQIFETGQVNGSIFMSLEYEARGSLSQFLHGKPQSAFESARFVASAATAVHAAHQQGLIHRDLKPGNLLLHPIADSNHDGLAGFTPKVSDFGLVKQIADESALTASRDVLGTPSYMAPEQVTTGTQSIGPATDVYSLGTVLYEMLTGRPPFRAATAIDTVVQVRFDEPVPPSRLIPSVPRDLETICLKCLEKEPGRRYRTAQDLAEDLIRFVEGHPVKARPVRWPLRMGRWMRRNPRIAALSALVLSLLATLAVLGPIVALRQAALRKNAEDSEAKALAQWDRADRNLLAANEAVWNAMLLQIAVLEQSQTPDSLQQQQQAIEGAMRVLEKARVNDPDLPTHRHRWAMALYLHGRTARRSGDWPRAEADIAEAIVFADRLASDRPDQVQNLVLAALIRLELAHLSAARSLPDAESRARDSLMQFETLTRLHTQIADLWYGLSESCQLLADRLASQPGRQTEVKDVQVKGKLAMVRILHRKRQPAAATTLLEEATSLAGTLPDSNQFKLQIEALHKLLHETP